MSGTGAGAGARPPMTQLGSASTDLGLHQNERHLFTTAVNSLQQSTITSSPAREEDGEGERRQQAQLQLAARRLAVQEQELTAAIAAEERMWEARLRQEEGLLALKRAEREAELDRDRALVAMQTDMAQRLARLREERDAKIVGFERARCGRLAVEDQEAHQHALARQALLAKKEELTCQLRCGQGLGPGSLFHDGETTQMSGELTIVTTAAVSAATTAIATTFTTTAAGGGDDGGCDGNKDEDALSPDLVVAPPVVLPPEVAPPLPPVDRSRDSFQVAMRRDRAAASRATAFGAGGVSGSVGGGIVGDVVDALKKDKDKDKASAVNSDGGAIGVGVGVIGVSTCDGLIAAGSSDRSVIIIGGSVTDGGAASSDVSMVSSMPSPIPLMSQSPPIPLSLPPPPSFSRAGSPPPSPSGPALLEEIKSFRGTFDFTTTTRSCSSAPRPPVGNSKPWLRPAGPAQGQGPVPLAVPPTGSGPPCKSSSRLNSNESGARARANLFGPSPRSSSVTLAASSTSRGVVRATADNPCRSDKDKGVATASTHPKPNPNPTNTRAASAARPNSTSRHLKSSSTSAQAPTISTSIAASVRRQSSVSRQSRSLSQPRASTPWLESPSQTPPRVNNAPSRQPPVRIDLPNTSPNPRQGLGQGIGLRQGQELAQGHGAAFSRNHPSPTRRPVHVTLAATANHTINNNPTAPPSTSPSRQGLARRLARPSPDHTKWTQSLRDLDEGAAASTTKTMSSPSRPRPPFVVDISLAPNPDNR